MPHWKSEDAKAGLMFLGIGLFFGIATLTSLPIGSLEEMGPGFFPLALCLVLLALGSAILFNAGEDIKPQAPVNWRAVVLIAAAPVAFGLTVRSLGLLPALLISVALAVLASKTLTRLHAAMVVVGVTVFCVVIFKFGVRVPFALFNPSLIK